MPLDATLIYGGLYQGSKPPRGDTLRLAGFDALVLCAEEYQPPAEAFPGVRVHHVPFDDDWERPLRRTELKPIVKAARFAADTLKRNRKVLVTCYMGWNRSGIVSALTLHFLLKLSGDKAAWLVRHHRPKALGNPMFLAHLSRVKGDPETDGMF